MKLQLTLIFILAITATFSVWTVVAGDQGSNSPDNTSEEIAFGYLSQDPEFSSLVSGDYTLESFHIREGLTGIHVRCYQRYAGIKVVDTQILVHITPNTDKFEVQSSAISDIQLQNIVAGLGRSDAAQNAIASVSFDQGFLAKESELMIYRDKKGDHLVWSVNVAGKVGSEQREVLVDASTGETLRDRSLVLESAPTGLIYEPNPVIMLQNTQLSGNSDGDSPELSQIRNNRELQGLDNSGFLTGAYVDLTAPGITGAYKPAGQALASTTASTTRLYNYTRSDDRFEEVMVYYHVDQNQRYIQSLGFNNIINRPLPAHAHYASVDNSFFSAAGYIAFGDGGTDDAEDADVIIHEYGHAIQWDQATNALFGPGEPGALGEGFGDYWAVSTHASNSNGYEIPCVAAWDRLGMTGPTSTIQCFSLNAPDGTQVHHPRIVSTICPLFVVVNCHQTHQFHLIL